MIKKEWEINEEDFEYEEYGRMGERDRLDLGLCKKGRKILFRQDLDEYCANARCFKEEVIGNQVEESFKNDPKPLSDSEFIDICEETGGYVYYVEYEDDKGRLLENGEYLGIDSRYVSVKGGEYNGTKRLSMDEMLKIVIENNYRR